MILCLTVFRALRRYYFVPLRSTILHIASSKNNPIIALMFKLKQHVHAAEVNGSLIFLNLKNNRYDYLAPRDAAKVLKSFYSGTSVKPYMRNHAEQDILGAEAIIDELKQNGLITEDDSERPFVQIKHDNVLKELPRLIGPDRPKVRVTHLWNFVRAVFLARAMLFFTPLHWVTRTIVRRKHRSFKTKEDSSTAQLTEIYRRLRPILFSRQERCLIDSLSLLNFLQWYNIQTTLCFGVKLEPFKAHAWVEHDGVVFDDMPAYIHSYTVILKV